MDGLRHLCMHAHSEHPSGKGSASRHGLAQGRTGCEREARSATLRPPVVDCCCVVCRHERQCTSRLVAQVKCSNAHKVHRQLQQLLQQHLTSEGTACQERMRCTPGFKRFPTASLARCTRLVLLDSARRSLACRVALQAGAGAAEAPWHASTGRRGASVGLSAFCGRRGIGRALHGLQNPTLPGWGRAREARMHPEPAANQSSQHQV
jgi:hypothetical protein